MSSKFKFQGPNGNYYKSESAYKRQLRAIYASYSQPQRKSFRSISYVKTRNEPKRVSGNAKSGITSVETQTDKIITFKSVKDERSGKYKLVEERGTQRINSVEKTDPETGKIVIIEGEESSRYTPSKVTYEIDNIDNSALQITATSNGRAVKSTTITNVPHESKEKQKLNLRNDFIKYQMTKNSEDRLSTRELVGLAKDLGGIKTGAPKQLKMEKRIRKRLEEQGVSFIEKPSSTQNVSQNPRVTRQKAKEFGKEELETINKAKRKEKKYNSDDIKK